MLTTIREKTQGWITGIILGLLAIPFALWGVNSYFESDSKLVVARVGDQEIGVAAFRNAVEEQRRSLQQSFGRNLDPKMFESREFKMRILDDLVDQALLARDAKDQGYVLGDRELARRITSIPAFQRNGRFDVKVYESALRGAGMTVRAFEANVRQDTVTKQVEDGFDHSAFVTNADMAAILRLETQARQASYVIVKPQQYLSKVSVSPAAIEEFYSANAARFKSPERVRIEYVRLSAGDLARKFKVTEDDLQKAYAQDIERFTTPEQRKVSHVLIRVSDKDGPEADKKALEKIQTLRKQLAAGADFAALAKKNSEDPGSAAKGGDLGFIGRNGSTVKAFEDAAFGLKKGEVSEPVRTSFGYHLIKLVDVKAKTRKPFKDARAELEAGIRAHKAEEQFYESSEKLNNLVYEQSDSLKPAADALGLQIEQSEWFARAGGEGIAADPRIVDAAYNPEVLIQGRNSNTIETAPNTLVALRVIAHQEAVAQPLTAVRTQIEDQLKGKMAQDAAQKDGERLVDLLRQGGSLPTLAKSQGLTVAGGKSITRGKPEGMDPQLVDAVFAAPKPEAGGPVYGVVPVGEGYAVYALTAVRDGAADQADDAIKNQARRMLGERRGREYYADYRSGLRSETKIKIYADQL